MKEFIGKILRNVKVLDKGGRGEKKNLEESGIGDVIVNLEEEKRGKEKMIGNEKYDVVVNEMRMIEELKVKVVDKVVEKRG